MFGQCFPGDPPFGGVPVFDPGAGAMGLGVVDVDVVGVVDCDVDGAVLVEPDAAPALEMPASAPPLASAPATIVAPSSFDVFMRSNLHLWGWVVVSIDRPLRG
jgi:hypothetical protein